MKIYESAENYLETILILQKSNSTVRAIDIASYLGFSKPSVSIAMKQLRENGYITIGDHGNISLTASGLEIASRIYERHTVLTGMLTDLGVNEETARLDACRIEHNISVESFEAIKKHLCQQAKKQ